ncbi:MAG TPA: hypothetical protein P5518_03055 [Candidatus Cloacimonas sp.]|jgi:hypothetical protein|nr:hypothetical protein [Candidatus Cloacimonadota bacterium]HNV92914.1 hypothetical protein [Candidatus Cloacimonas sp.]MDD3733279.1 hypothetical protein [Candidatus Cloacimonadota bacterium]HOQ77280.1 hypothetical protein [Candidatus Cloacimonas sp.]HOU26340.1 hypothetical protein [Candidatus Cloacimonas sp.]
MKRLIYIIVIIALLPVFANAQANFEVNFVPSSIRINSLSTASFDPTQPDLQPILTTLMIKNLNTTPCRIDLKVALYWNNLLLANTIFCSREDFTLGYCTLNNRDLITDEPMLNFEFKSGSTSISVEDILDASSTLKSAVMAGYFPDGELKFKVWVREFSETPWEGADNSPSAEFKIIIRNAGNITLLAPGRPIGQNPDKVSGLPISFLWNSQITGFNDYKLIIREYAPNNPPTINNVERTGSLFYETPSGKNECSGFSDFLPFTDSNYYAWKVTTALANEFNPIARGNKNNSLSSNWYIFQYVDEQEAAHSISEFQAHLDLLQNPTLINIHTQGYLPVGVVVIEGKTYSGQEAINLIDALLGQDISVELKK